MARRFAVLALFIGTLLIGAAYASAFAPGGAPAWGAWSMALGVAVMMVASMVLGAARPGVRLGGLWGVFAFRFVLIAGCFGAALVLPAEGADSALLLGLPRRAAILMYGIGLLPIFVLPVAYAMTFDRVTLSEADLARVRERAAALRAGGER
jgi:hypothetical protein